MVSIAIIGALHFLMATSTQAQSHLADNTVQLWPGTPPGSEAKTGEEKVRIYAPTGDHIVSSVSRPSITVFLPKGRNATGAGVVIVPGGGHSEIWIDHEGFAVARWMADHGIAGFVLKYRLAREAGSP